MEILDWYGNPVEFDPQPYADENAKWIESGYVYQGPLLKGQFGANTLEERLEFWRSSSDETLYLFNRMMAEVEVACGRRVTNGYSATPVCGPDDIETALADCDRHHTDKLAWQYAALNGFVLTADEASVAMVPHKNIYKTVIYVYALCVLRAAPGIAMEASKDSYALSVLKKDGLCSEMFADVVKSRVEDEIKKRNG